MSCLYLHEILPASAFTSAFHISHGLIDSLIRYSVFKVQTANLFDLLKACRRGTRKQSLLRHGHSPSSSCHGSVRLCKHTHRPCHEDHSSLLSWRLRDSNSRPPASKAGALPTELSPHLIRQPPAFPYRLQYSIIGRLGLNHRVRDENGCLP